MKIALVVGHNERSQGAYNSYVHKSEYEYYREIAKNLKNTLGDKIDIYIRTPNKTYGAEMREVLNRLNSMDYDYVLELHFNSASNVNVQGTECLAFHNSKIGLELANKFNELISKTMNIKNRGIIKITNSNQRGGYGICKAKQPYVLIEPFFCTNEKAKEFTIDKMTSLILKFITE